LVLERSLSQGSRPWSWYSSIEVYIRRRYSFGFPLMLERFWPWLITYSMCLLSPHCLCIGRCLMKNIVLSIVCNCGLVLHVFVYEKLVGFVNYEKSSV